MILDIPVLRGIVLIWAVTTMAESETALQPFRILLIDSSNITNLTGVLPYKICIPKHTCVPTTAAPKTSAQTKAAPERRSYIEKLILGKVNDLKPFLYDNNKTQEVIKENEVSSKYLLRENSQPKLEENSVDIYKNITEIINKALMKEQSSDKTSILIKKTIENLIKKAAEKKCFWNRGRSGDNNGIAIIDKEKEISEERSQYWESLMDETLKFTEIKDKDSELLNKFNKVPSEIINQINKYSKKYKIKCQLIDTTKIGKKKKVNKMIKIKNRKPKKIKRMEETDEKKTQKKNRFPNEHDPCASFKVCSDELKIFLIDFYKNLNDTAVSVFGNYAEMYNLDVTNNDEKQLVHGLIKNLSSNVGHNVAIKFEKEINKLQLSKNNTQTNNYRIIKGFVKTTIDNVKKKLKKFLVDKTVELNQRTRTTVEDDISVNLDVDLNNLEKDIKDRICSIFAFCNGKINTHNRRVDKDSYRKQVTQNNDISFKVQLTIDEKVNELFEESRKVNGVENFNQVFNYTKQYNVTRTTLISSPVYARGGRST